MFDTAEEDLTYIHTVAQGLISRAFEQGLIHVWVNGRKYKVKAIAYDSTGAIDIFKGSRTDGQIDQKRQEESGSHDG